MNEAKYLELLKRARGELPTQVFEKSRFQLPRIKIFREGNKTAILNWHEVIRVMNRDSNQVAKFMARELATSSDVEGTRLILQGKFPDSIVESNIDTYCQNYVICPECGKPDTKLIREGKSRITTMICEACGARRSVKGVT
ncbi:MAG: translation initiation factor IF-2 subunit beta [Promethearchaeota archaeon]